MGVKRNRNQSLTPTSSSEDSGPESSGSEDTRSECEKRVDANRKEVREMMRKVMSEVSKYVVSCVLYHTY